MLKWYQELIELRREAVIPEERTCRAELVDASIVLQVPASDPRLRVIAEFPDSQRQSPPTPAEWKETLSSDADGYRVRVFKKV